MELLCPLLVRTKQTTPFLVPSRSTTSSVSTALQSPSISISATQAGTGTEVATLKDLLADLTALITRQAAALQALTQQTVANPPAIVVQQGVNRMSLLQHQPCPPLQLLPLPHRPDKTCHSPYRYHISYTDFAYRNTD